VEVSKVSKQKLLAKGNNKCQCLLNVKHASSTQTLALYKSFTYLLTYLH